MIECVRRSSRNVKRWQSGEMALRWTAAGMLEAERQFRRVIGDRDPAKLAVAIERDLARTTDRSGLRFREPPPTVVVAQEGV
jgi:putative transposase